MKRLAGFLYHSRLYAVLSILLVMVMAISLLPNEVLARDLHTAPIAPTPSYVEVFASPASTPTDPQPEETPPIDNPAETPPAEPSPIPVLPSVSTLDSPTEITDISATLQGELTSLGTAEKVQVAFAYGEESLDSISDSIEMTTPGSFTILVQDLKPATNYHYQAQAVSDIGISTGEEFTFTTLSAENPEITPAPTPDELPLPSPTETPQSTPEPTPIAQPAPVPEKTTVKVKPDEDSVISSVSNKIKLKVPKDTLEAETDVEIAEYPPFESTGMTVIKHFELNAYETDSKSKITKFKQGLEISIQNEESELKGIDPDSLRLYYLDEETLQWLPVENSYFDTETGILTATLTHFTNFGEMANPLSNGPGRVMAAQVNMHSGASTFDYPIELPPGPGGFQPSVAFNYNSASVDEMKNKRDMGSWVGTGWSLNLGKINLDLNTSKYYLDMGGTSYELISTDSINYHTNPEQYLKITRSTNTWDIWDKSGTHYQYGGTADSQQYTYTTAQTYYRWDLNLIQDTNGNKATISYARDIQIVTPNAYVRSAYPEYLKYNFDQNNNALYEVHFVSGYDQSDPTDGYIRKDNPKSNGSNPAPKIMETRKLNSIEVKVSGNLIRKYGLTYNTDASLDRVYSSDYGGIYYAGKLRLLGLTQYGADNISTLPATSFTYQDLQTYRHTSEGDYVGNPGNPASFTWPILPKLIAAMGEASSSLIPNCLIMELILHPIGPPRL